METHLAPLLSFVTIYTVVSFFFAYEFSSHGLYIHAEHNKYTRYIKLSRSWSLKITYNIQSMQPQKLNKLQNMHI